MIKKQDRVSISKGNKKMGYIKSVSFPPVVTCPRGVPCAKKCYAVRLCARRENCRRAYARNLRIYQKDPASFWLQVQAAACTERFFRYNVSGDIPDPAFLLGMIETAQRLPDTRFLAFTKQYALVNNLVSLGVQIPANLVIVFSLWGPDWPVPNPYNFPVCDVVFKGKPVDPLKFLCPGNCTTCAVNRVGCFWMKHGDAVQIKEH